MGGKNETLSIKETVDAVIPVYKPDDRFERLLRMLKEQSYPVRKIILMITTAEDAKYPDFSAFEEIEVHELPPEKFDHGETRNLGASFSDADYLLFMTQDAEPADPYFVEELIKGFGTENVRAVYARQIPRPDATELERRIRSFNYPDEDRIQDLSVLEKYGVKTYFCSNVAALYDRQEFESLGGFVHKTVFNEDMIYAYRLIQAGYRILYAASARVRHSHDYSAGEEFHRNFDLGASQADHPEIFGSISSEKEGASLVRTVISGLFRDGKAYLIFPFVYRILCKYIGYRYGKRYRKLSKERVIRFSQNKQYWENYYGSDQGDSM